MSISCESNRSNKDNIASNTPIQQLVKKVIFNPQNTQDFQSVLMIYDKADDKSLGGEEIVLQGLAHIYQGEVYKIVANLLARMQLDLYYKSTDPDHGTKFPISENVADIADELMFWIGMDAYTVHGCKEGQLILDNNKNGKLSLIKQLVKESLSTSQIYNYQSQTFLPVKDNKIFQLSKELLPFLSKVLAAEQLFKSGKYLKLLTYLDKNELYTQDIFKKHQHIEYYSPAIFKLAALSHFKLGVKKLELALQTEFHTTDSTGYQIIAILNLGHQYHFFEDSGMLVGLWRQYRSFLVEQGDLLRKMVKGKVNMPYSLDWIRFINAVNSLRNEESFPVEYYSYKTDPELWIITQFIVNPADESLHRDVRNMLLEFIRIPEKMDKYPTLMSGFVEELNISPLASVEKELIQEISENLVFNVKHSKASWQRNRPAFLLSLYGTLRWHGGRLPDCNQFLIDLKDRDSNLSSLFEIVALFTQALIL